MAVQDSDICMDKEPDTILTFSNAISNDSNHATTNPADAVQICEHVDEDIQSNVSEENAEASECEVKECTTEKSVEVATLLQVENCNEQNIPSTEHEIGTPEEELKFENLKVKDDSKRPKVSVKPTIRSGSSSCKTKCTVPRPFALATAKRASFGARPLGTEPDNGTTNKTFNMSTIQHLSKARQNQALSPLVQRKPLQPNNKKRPDEDDSCSVASSVASIRKPKTTIASAPVFKCTERAERRKEFYSKLEEKHQAMVTEKTEWEERTKEEQEASIKQLRKSMLFKANPMPSFYHEGPPPKVELKKPPPTRAKSPKLGRRKSCSDTAGVEKGLGAFGRGIHPSFDIYRDSGTISSTKRKDLVNVQNRSNTAKYRDVDEPIGLVDETFTAMQNSGMSMDIAVQS